MRKITLQAVTAFMMGQNFSSGNTRVVCEGRFATLRLHGNAIANRDGNTVMLTDAGWQTTTTKERLNGLLEVMGKAGMKISQRKGVWYWGNGDEFASDQWNRVK